MTNHFGVSFAVEFGIDENWLAKKKIFNPTLDVDSPLFIDPFLLPNSIHKEFSDCAFDEYEKRFTTIYKLLSKSQSKSDKYWKGAREQFRFGEVKGVNGTCLGYSKGSTQGHAFGPKLSEQALEWAKEVVDLGVKDPELFSCMPVFEDGIGADRISDMITRISIDCIIKFNVRVLAEIDKELGVKIPVKEFNLDGRKVNLPENPFSNSPVILVAEDVLKHLPQFDDAKNLRLVVEDNADLRARVNKHLGEVFKIRYKKDKEHVRKQAMLSASAFQAFLDALKLLENTPYDVNKDPLGLLQWRDAADIYLAQFPLKIQDDKNLSRVERIDKVVLQIITKFQELVEDNRMWRVFYVDNEPRHEKFAQLLFQSIADSYCDANDLDISPEADAGAGPIDFKFSQGKDKIVVEIKLSTNSSVVNGYRKQLKAYANAEKTDRGHYVVIDVGKIGKKWETLEVITKEKDNQKFAKHKKIHLIDGNIRHSASKLK